MPIETPAGTLEVENAKFRASSVEATIAVGIGTDSNDAYPLQVFKETAPSIRLSEGSTISSAARFYSNNSNLYIQTGTDFSSGSSGDVAFQTMGGQSTHMVIKNDGKVGVGVTNPLNSLIVKGKTTIGTGASTTNSQYHDGTLNVIGGGTRAILRVENNNGVGDPTIILGEGGGFTENTVPTIKKIAGTNNLSIMTAGNVGIGTVSPGAILDLHTPSTDPSVPTLFVGDQVRDFGDYGMVQLARHPTAGGSKAHLAFIRGANAVSAMGFYNNTNTFGIWTPFGSVANLPTMSFLSDKVGIGTTSPAVPLDIKTTGNYNGIGLLGSSSGRYTLSTNSTGQHLYMSNGSYSFGRWVQAHHYDVYSTSAFTGSRDLFLNYYSGAGVKLAGHVYVTSDDRIKTEERYIENATETLLKLKPQIYLKGPNVGSTSNMSRIESGLIAQDVYYDAPELRHLVSLADDAEPTETKPYTDDDPQNDPDYSSWGSKSAGLEYEGLIAYLIKSNQELYTEIQTLKSRIASLENP